MQFMGFFLVLVALVAIVAGILSHLKAKKILAAPFRKTGEVAKNPQVAGPKGIVSCEGAVVAPTPLVAPCSGKPCLYYQIDLVRHWEKTVNTENGVKTEKGTTHLSTTKLGSQFQIDDGSGPVGVDARESLDCELDKSFEQMQGVAWGDVVFGQYRAHVTSSGGDQRSVGVKCVEKIVPAHGNLFVLGKLSPTGIGKTDGLLGKLLAATKGRDKLLGTTKRNAMIGFVVGGLSFAGGLPMAIFGEPPHDSCAHMKDAWAETCAGHITDDSGNTYDWTVTKPGTYSIEVLQPNVKIPIDPVLTVTASDGTEVAHVESATSVGIKRIFPAGIYKINVRDSVKGAPARFKGGFSYSLKFEGDPSAPPPPSAPASAAPSSADSAAAPSRGPGGSVHPASHAATATPHAPSTAPQGKPSGPPPKVAATKAKHP